MAAQSVRCALSSDEDRGRALLRSNRMPHGDIVVMGIDPGTRAVGWGVVAIQGRETLALGAGVLKPDLRLAVPGRLGEIRAAVDRLLAEFRPHVVVVEEAFAAKNPQSALRIGEGRGVVLACAATAGVEIRQLPPAVAKKALVGHGAAHKSQVAGMVARLLGLSEPPKPLDATDALALALTHALHRGSPLAIGARERGKRSLRAVERALATRAIAR